MTREHSFTQRVQCEAINLPSMHIQHLHIFLLYTCTHIYTFNYMCCVEMNKSFVACRVFANAESLFYYARKGRPSRRTLSQEEIMALLAQARISSTEVEAKAGKGMKKKSPKKSIHTIHEVDPKLGKEENFEERDPLILSSGLGKKGKRKPTPTIHEIDQDSPHGGGSYGEEEKEENSSMNRSRLGSGISDNVFMGSNPATPLSSPGVEDSLTIGNTSSPQSSLSEQLSSQQEGDKLAPVDGQGGNDVRHIIMVYIKQCD